MITGQPENARRFIIQLETVIDGFQVVDQVAMREHDSLGLAGGAGCILKECERFSGNIGVTPIRFQARRDVVAV